ncbi:unnamed protein product, partial [Pleuronectes platessa]
TRILPKTRTPSFVGGLCSRMRGWRPLRACRAGRVGVGKAGIWMFGAFPNSRRCNHHSAQPVVFSDQSTRDRFKERGGGRERGQKGEAELLSLWCSIEEVADVPVGSRTRTEFEGRRMTSQALTSTTPSNPTFLKPARVRCAQVLVLCFHSPNKPKEAVVRKSEIRSFDHYLELEQTYVGANALSSTVTSSATSNELIGRGG